jgi:4-amino-4-deoxy-L-arabinose transferase-like glycosyltransferase
MNTRRGRDPTSRTTILVAIVGVVGVVAVALLAPQDPDLGYEAEPPLLWGILLGFAVCAVTLAVAAPSFAHPEGGF